MVITDAILPRVDHYQGRTLLDVKYFVIHRIGLGTTGAEVAQEFTEKTDKYQAGWYTGGKVPYHFVIRKDGTVDQLAPLGKVVMGAIGLNRNGLHIALVGDARNYPPTVIQAQALVELLTMLVVAWPLKPKIIGHTEVPGSSTDPDKSCPGRCLSLSDLRDLVSARTSTQEVLNKQGVRI